MELERLFSLAGSAALLGWGALAVSTLFRLRSLRRLVAGLLVPVGLGVAYTFQHFKRIEHGRIPHGRAAEVTVSPIHMQCRPAASRCRQMHPVRPAWYRWPRLVRQCP